MHSNLTESPAPATEDSHLVRIFVLIPTIDLWTLSPTADGQEVIDAIERRAEVIDPATSGSRLIRMFGTLGFTVPDAYHLWDAVENSPAENQVDLVHLIGAGAFSRSELMAPERMLAYFDRPNWPEILRIWKEESGATRQIRHVVRRLGKPTPPPPPAPSSRAPIEPVSEREAPPHRSLGDLLPGKLKKHAANVKAAIDELASQPRIRYTAEDLARAVERRRKSAGVVCPVHILKNALNALARHGKVIAENGQYQHKPVAV